ncbi:polysaccharide biosynthesis protein [Sphingobacterium psychroaquaticum]|uniref:lipopolysaccharide biosynthesis protein n=1 Tax=Sphingobacterium psychroaquaticum TaxID=561061 RepID=UPI00106C76B3|nr:oligosaccharide flippase family protein [Sphingobacterium psychroaquaticum]QBQ42578.1 polysaccharide biosynthesis protein [Sphingobacterium psychroaquaticum]
MSVVKRFLNDTAIYGLSTIVSRLLNFILTPILVRKLDTGIYGIFTNMYSWSALINTFLAFGMETTYFRYLQKVDEKDKMKVFNNSFIVTIFTSLVFLFVLFSVISPASEWFAANGLQSVADYKQYICFMGLILAIDALAVVPFAKLRSENRPVRYALLKTINICVFVCFTLSFMVFIPWLIRTFPSLEGFFTWYKGMWLGYVFLSNLIASAVTLLMLWPQIRGFSFRVDKKLLNSMFSYSLPIFIANVSFIVNEHLDKILLPSLLPGNVGERELGIYGAISKIAMFLSIFVQAFRLGAEPFFFSYAKNENAKKVYAVIMEYFVIAMVLVMVGLSMNIEWLKYFIKGGNAEQVARYWSGLDYIPIILFNYVLLGIYMNLSVWYKLSDQTKYGLYISGIGALVTIVLCYVLIPKYSYVGAILVTSIAYTVMVLLSYFWGQRNYPIPYKVGKTVGYLALGGALVAINYVFFARNFWSGNALLFVYCAVVLYNERVVLLGLLKRG